MPSWNVVLGAGVATGVLGYVVGKRRSKAAAQPVTVVTVPGGEAPDLDENATDIRCAVANDVVVTDDVAIRELFGGASTGTSTLSIAHVNVKRAWHEEWQQPEFDEWTCVLKGVVRIERARGASLNVRAGEAVFLPRGELVRWVFPDPSNLPEYVAICGPAFSPDNCGRGVEPAEAELPKYETFPALYHAAPKLAWDAAVRAGRPYVPETYDADGFVHATADPALLMPVLNHFYQDKAGDFVCLRMERKTLAERGVRVCFEFPAPVGNKATFHNRKYGSTLFPHIYAPIEEGMVCAALPIIRAAPGHGEFVKVDCGL